MDYGERQYDNVLGRWLVVDPMTDNQESWSPYHYTYDNPVRFTDPDGREPCCGGAMSFIAGVVEAYRDDVASLDGRSSMGHVQVSNAESYNNGRIVGHLVAGFQGLGETITGGSATAGGVVAAPATAGASLGVSAGGVALIAHGLNTMKNAGQNLYEDKGKLNSSSTKQEGSYTNTHESGKKYHGKGDENRAAKSGAEKAKTHNDPLKSTDWTPAKNTREAFKQESKRIGTDRVGNTPGHKNPNNYNKRASPGDKYRTQDGN